MKIKEKKDMQFEKVLTKKVLIIFLLIPVP